MIDFRHKSFLAVYQIGSFTKAAETLCITQSAVSQHIKFLEKEYGGKLFTREEGSLRPTLRGKALYAFVSRVNADSIHLLHTLEHLQAPYTDMHFGATLSIGEYVMPSVLEQLLSMSPKARLHMQIHNTRVLLEKLQEGEIAFALIEGFFDKEKYGWELFSEEPFLAVCSPRSPLAQKKVDWSRLFQERLLLREEGSGTREILEQILRENHHSAESFQNVCVIGNMNVIKKLTEDNLGIAFLYRVVAEKELAAGRLEAVQMQDFQAKRAFHFVYLKGSQHAEAYLEWYHLMMKIRIALKNDD